MPLQSFIDNELPTIKAAWLNGVDVLYFTVFAAATTVGQALTALGFSAFGISLSQAANAAAGRAVLSVPPQALRVSVATVAGAMDLTTATPNSDDVIFTGSLTPTSFTIAVNRIIRVVAQNAFTLPNNASIVTNTGANLSVRAGQSLVLRATAANVVEVLFYSPATANNIWRPGFVFTWSGSSAPSGSLALPLVATNISRTTYVALFAAIGTTWGVGDGSTTFGMPWLPANYTALQANANVGTASIGQMPAHNHTTSFDPSVGACAAGAGTGRQTTTSTSTAGSGTDNLAAGHRFLYCVQTE